MSDVLTIRAGTAYALLAYEVAYAIDLEAAEQRLAAGTERLTVKQKRRAPASFAYRPAPLRVTQTADPVPVGALFTAPQVEVVLYDFGAVSVGYAIPLAGPLDTLPPLSAELYGNERLLADSHRLVERLLAMLGPAAGRPRIAGVVEDYPVFQLDAVPPPGAASQLWSEHAGIIARILRAEPGGLSQQETTDATAARLSFGTDDATFIDSDVALVLDDEADDVRAVLELANTQLLEMRYLDEQLDTVLDRAYEMLARRRGPRIGLRRRAGPDVRRLAELQLDGAILFEHVTNAVKLFGDQYLARVYGLVSRPFHLAAWDASISRKLQTIESIYAKMVDRAATQRMEALEWIIIALIAVSLVLPFLTGLLRH